MANPKMDPAQTPSRGSDKTSRRIAWEAAKLLQRGSEKDWQRARIVAARRLYRGRIPDDRMPGEAAIREALLSLVGDSASAGNRYGDQAEPDQAGRHAYFRSLLRPLETVAQSPRSHPEGDALYHSLQVFELVRVEAPYDEELLLAALLHDVGLAVDPLNPAAASLQLLGDLVTERTRWLIENHREIRTQYDGSLSARRRRFLRTHPWYEDLELLCEADLGGRQRGVPTADEDEALNYIASLTTAF